MKKALYAGSFDPPTVGHMDIIQRASGLFELLYVGIAQNSTKQKVFYTVEERLNALQNHLKAFKNVKVVLIEGLTAEFAKKNQIDVLVRSLRNGSDYAQESAMAYANKEIGGPETIFLPASPEYSAVNATIVREIVWAGGDISSFLPISK